MKTPMTKEIFDIIYWIQIQRKAYAILHHSILKDNYNYFKDVYNLYNSIPLTNGMNYSIACFEAVIGYPITDQMMEMETDELPKHFEFGF